MLLKLTHQTDLTYSDLISESVMELRMAPRQEQDQHRLSFTLAIGPPTSANSYFDWMGNTVHWFTVASFHKQIRIVATSVVETDRPLVDVRALPDTWPVKPLTADYALYDFTHFRGPIVDSPALHKLVERIKPKAGESLGGLAMRTLDVVKEKFVFKKGVTKATSPITEILEKGAGVCQDFTQLMIGVARAIGIPARYVSGLVHPDASSYVGATETHAWCELMFPSIGWMGFDPANHRQVGANYVKVAVGRDYLDIAPNKGRYTGKVSESIVVTVNSEELPSVPPELAAERIQSLAIPTYESGSMGHIDPNQQTEHQQQQ
ncbi:MAG TPA: transglutaminase family protein [Tepidisphaeraceae bacterium]|jgi:transglutaminase-like putative cysteine protease|nr:transglutaminase family protein [Tepidisphaeraceae bacterium]